MLTSKKKRNPLDIEKFISYWNKRYPFDLMYRLKYKIGFGSPEHKQLSFINMSIDLKEDLMIKRDMKKEQQEKDTDFFNSGLPTELTGNKGAVKVVKMTKKQVDAEFDDLDLSQFNNPK